MKPYKIFAELIEQDALDQFHQAMEQKFVVKGALMPDAHKGYSLPIGAVVATKNVIVPSWVGYDIGCGMCAIPTSFTLSDIYQNAQAIWARIQEAIPVGFNHHDTHQTWDRYSTIEKTETAINIFNYKNGIGWRQLGTLGGGNHFIEIGSDENGVIWIIVHSGSRGIGHAIATHYMKIAGGGKAREGSYGLDVNSPNGKDYIIDLNFALEFALENRFKIINQVSNVIEEYCKGSLDWSCFINRNHNHAEEKDGLWIHRKGATHAEAGMEGVIPGNMRDGSFIVVGKGNPESLYSSSHGAGRVLGRNVAKKILDINDFTETMKGIVANVDDSTLDESPFAYKNIFDVMKQQEELVSVKYYVKPIINVKG